MARTVYHSERFGAEIHDRELARLLSERGDRVTAVTEGPA